MKKILFTFGTRPEAIKLAPVIKVFSKKFIVKTCITSQHKEMLDQVLDIFNIIPDYDLDIMKKKQDLFDISKNILNKYKEILIEENPDLILVHGDTTTSTIAALSGFYLKIPIGHIEAGLRTNNKYSPYPEEINRQITARLSNLHFAPTEKAKNNLIKENIDQRTIYVTGNTIVDAIKMIIDFSKKEKLKKEILIKIPFLDEEYSDYKIILVTCHRRENFGEGIENICNALKKIALSDTKIKIIFPVHYNPNVSGLVRKKLNKIKNIYLIDPVDYISFVKLMKLSYLILTDSGGIQEEAPSLGKPVLVMREDSERPEAILLGTAKLVGTDSKTIIKSTLNLIKDKKLYNKMVADKNPYGNGKSSSKILKIVENYFK